MGKQYNNYYNSTVDTNDDTSTNTKKHNQKKSFPLDVDNNTQKQNESGNDINIENKMDDDKDLLKMQMNSQKLVESIPNNSNNNIKIPTIINPNSVQFTVTVDALNVRKNPSYDAEVIKIVKKGALLLADPHENDKMLFREDFQNGYETNEDLWLKIFRPCEGYVKYDFVTFVNKNNI